MSSLDERVALLDGRIQEQAVSMADVRATCAELRLSIRDLHQEMDRRFGEVRAEMDRRFERVDQRFDRVEQRFDRVDDRFDRMEQRFAWLVGIVVTGFVAVIGVVAGAFWNLLQTVR